MGSRISEGVSTEKKLGSKRGESQRVNRSQKVRDGDQEKGGLSTEGQGGARPAEHEV